MAEPQPFQLTPGTLTLPQLRKFWRGPRPVALDPDCHGAIEASAQTVADILREGRSVYGINTGFGSLAGTTIEPGQVVEYDRKMYRRRQNCRCGETAWEMLGASGLVHRGTVRRTSFRRSRRSWSAC